MKVAYLGPKGSFTYIATSHFFEKETYISYPTIPSCLKAVEIGDVDYSVIPIENTIEGTVNPTLDYLYAKGTLPVQAEIILPISQQLMVHSQWTHCWQEIKTIASHPQALAQSQQFLSDYLPRATQKMMESTTEAAKWVAEHPSVSLATIGSKAAAKEYGLEIVKTDIQDIELNETRFWIVGKQPVGNISLVSKASRKSITVEMTHNKPGNLHKILSAFSWRDLDLTKIESRPLKTKLGDYFFLIDINRTNDALIDMTLNELKLLGGTVKQLGAYDVYDVTES